MRRYIVPFLFCLTPWATFAQPTPPLPAEGAAGTYCEPGQKDGAHLVVFAGWTVKPEWAWRWLQALQSATGAGKATGLVCAVRGPADASFVAKDIDARAFAVSLQEQMGSGSAPISFIAHSSGAFVAHYLMQQLRKQGAAGLLARIRYINLDGAIGRGDRELDADLVRQLASVEAVLARSAQDGMESINAGAMRELALRYPSAVRLRVLETADSGCEPRARWCLHQVLVNRRPHDPRNFDLARDYGQISAAHPVQWDYLKEPVRPPTGP